MRQVLVVAESAIARAGLTALITEQTDQWQVSSVADLSSWLQRPPTEMPDVVLIDLSHSGSQVTADLLGILEDCPAAVVVLVEQWPEPNWAEILRSGVQGLLLSEATAGAIVAALEAAAAGLVVLHPNLVEELLATAPSLSRMAGEAPTQPLTNREVEVLTLLAEGVGNKTIARRLTLSEHTVKFHISTIFAKLNVSSRTEAVIVGARLGLILL
ncbi:response regulator transcription factor [Pseudanabaena sp. FACHB-2040]|uniref:LuxR C-terminal-related transcriptional regulator n=1 Tax=Pseudanabaena sp. FACHB-2040 TaxID=2692859 RepID=UPI001683E56C|nr:response regulator transcription factor [Pseudanabaena sp. FACHB-2040]